MSATDGQRPASVTNSLSCQTSISMPVAGPIADRPPEHSEALARTRYHQQVFDWLEQTPGVGW